MNNYLKLNWIDITLIIILFFLSNSLSYFAYFPAYIFSFDPYILTPFAILVNYSIIFTTYYFIVLRQKKERYKFNYSFNNFHLLPIILLLFIGQYLISEFITGLIPTKGKYFGDLYNLMTNSLMGNINKHPIVTFIITCVIAPICEEIFFRGFILKGMLNNKIEPTKAIIISALIFGGIHLFPWQVVGGFISGLILGLAFYKTGSLLTSTLLHFINNLIAFFIFMKYKSLETPDLGFNELLLLPIGIILILIFGYLYLKLTKNHIWKYY